jgi:hypothetical protein
VYHDDRMRLSPKALNRATLARQMLLRREPIGVADAVQRVVGLQAQEPASPYLALWNRLAGFDPAHLDAAFEERTLVRASLLRLTLHAVHADDYPHLHRVMAPSLRASRLADRRFTSTGASAADADALLPHLHAFTAEPRTGAEVEAMLAARLGATNERLWWALRRFAPLHHAPTGGPWSFGGPSAFVAAPATPGPDGHDVAVQGLLLRYLRAFGPATLADFEQFTMLRRAVTRRALEAVSGAVERLEGPGGQALLDVVGAEVPAADAPAAPRLLPMWDNVLLAYADRSRVVPEEFRPLAIRRNGDVLPVVLVDGRVAGLWRALEGGVEVTAFRTLDAPTWDALETEAQALTAFLADREVGVYRRYDHWWRKGIPAAEKRVLG